MKYFTIPLITAFFLLTTLLSSQEIPYVSNGSKIISLSDLETKNSDLNFTTPVGDQPLKLNERVKPVVYDVVNKSYYYHNGKEWIPITDRSTINNIDLINLNNGNVRIGVGTAEQKLHVFGNTKISDSGNSDGKLFIGTTPTDETSAAGYKLLVGGKGIMTELKVNVTNSWPDYVFDSSYKMMTLDELEQFINTNKHLPGIPNAFQVEKDKGFHVGEMQKTLLEKIEELTLHLIDLKKENEEMKSELNEIKRQISDSNFRQIKE